MLKTLEERSLFITIDERVYQEAFGKEWVDED